MFQQVPALNYTRAAWTLNDVKKVDGVNKLVATHVCYVVQHGRNPVYAVADLKNGKTSRFTGSIDALHKIYKPKVLAKVLLQTRALGIIDMLDTVKRLEDLDAQLDGDEIKAEPKEIVRSSEVTAHA